MSGPPAELVDPFQYNFIVKWDGRYVAAVTSVTGLTRRTAVVSSHAGGQPQSALGIPGQTDYEPVRLERGITTDTAFQDWANLLWDYPNSQKKNRLAILKMAEHICATHKTLGGQTQDYEWQQLQDDLLIYVGLSRYDFQLMAESLMEGLGGGDYIKV